MNKQNFCDIFGEIDERYIVEAHAIHASAKHTVQTRRWFAAAACLCVLTVFAAFAVPLVSRTLPGGAQPHIDEPFFSTPATTGAPSVTPSDAPVPADRIAVNRPDELVSADIDCYTLHPEPTPDGQLAELDGFSENTGIDYRQFLSVFPERWTQRGAYMLFAPAALGADGEKEYRLHDYVFGFDTEGGGSITVSLCTFEAPLRDTYIMCDDPEPSEIGGATAYIYSDGVYFVAQFEAGALYFDLSGDALALDELTGLISSLVTLAAE